MDGSSTGDRGVDHGKDRGGGGAGNGAANVASGGADRRIGEWAELSAMSRPPAVNEAALRGGVEVASAGRRRSRQPLAGLAAAVVVVLVAAGLGFGLAGRPSGAPSSVVPSASSSARATESESAVVSPAGSPTDSWFSLSPSSAPSPLPSGTSLGDRVFQMNRLDAMSGWALVETKAAAGRDAGAPRLLLTNDAGTTWRDATPSAETDYQPTIEFIDPGHGWILGVNFLWSTADGGLSWHMTALPANTHGGSAAMSFVSASTGYLLLSANVDRAMATWALYRTDDAGASLQSVGAVTLPDEPGSSGPQPVMAFSDRLDGLIAGWKAVLQTRDGGIHWSTVSLPAAQGTGTARYSGVYQLRVFGQSVVLVAWVGVPTQATSYVSDDGGRTWRPAKSAEQAPDYWTIVDPQTWLELGMNDTKSVHIRVTRDAGASWTSSTGSGPAGRHVMAVSFVSPTEGWAIFQVDSTCPPGFNCPFMMPAGQLAETHDGGVTWQVLP